MLRVEVVGVELRMGVEGEEILRVDEILLGLVGNRSLLRDVGERLL